MRIALLTAGRDRPYALGMAGALLDKGVELDFIGNDEMQEEEIFTSPKATYFNLRGEQSSNAGLVTKIYRVLAYYWKLLKYAASTETKIFHILWLNKFVLFDSTLLNLFYKLKGKKLVYTAHNVNMKARDGGDNILNRMSLKFLYWIVDHIFVHTRTMKDDLMREFGVEAEKVTVILFGINSTVPDTSLDHAKARNMLNLPQDAMVLLFFGNIAPYKGLEILIEAMHLLGPEAPDAKLVIAGGVKGSAGYWKKLEEMMSALDLNGKVIKRIEYISDDEVEVFFKAADALVLPYKFIYQSGPLFLAYNFGLPVIANNVGSFKDDIVEGKTGFVSVGNDPKSLAETIKKFADSPMYKGRVRSSEFIKAYANDKYSWDSIADIIVNAYEEVHPRESHGKNGVKSLE